MEYWGYAAVLLYVGVLIVLSEFLLRRILPQEICRKVLHIGTCFAYPIAGFFFGDDFLKFAVLCGVFVFVTAVMYKTNSLKTVDGREKSYPGIVYYAISLFLLSLTSVFLPVGGTVFFISMLSLSFGDGFATLLGLYFPFVKIYKNKTLVGFLSCALFTFLSASVYQSLTAWVLSWQQLLLISLLAAVIELVDFGLDNIAIPVSVFLSSVGVLTLDGFETALLIGLLVFFVAFFTKLIAYYGALLASFLGALFYFAFGIYGILFVLFCYAVMIAVSFVSKWLKNDISDVVKKTKGKDVVEVFANGFWGIVAALLFLVTENTVFYAVALMTVSASFVDSLASDVGTLSKKVPYDIFKRMRVSRGVSGGVTLLGSLASLIGAFVFATAIVLILAWTWWYTPVIALVLYAGAWVDTLLGSLCQVKYRCSVCAKTTEKEVHCQQPCEIVGGCRHINNDTVNILSNTAVFLLSLMFLFLK